MPPAPELLLWPLPPLPLALELLLLWPPLPPAPELLLLVAVLTAVLLCPLPLVTALALLCPLPLVTALALLWPLLALPCPPDPVGPEEGSTLTSPPQSTIDAEPRAPSPINKATVRVFEA